ncbi:MAG TPA: PIG-L family deacetylase [Phototrophicaceae bacterium]|jgi:LmbE family N-acetylglucosaminyl deacetylase|nr:PIG-L family deacetylase [Phototrophicaceae bacterium]
MQNTKKNLRLLIAYAHPDDESFGLGGLIAKYVSEGVDVYLICATDGDVGTVSPEHMQGYNSIRELRLAELDKASVILGFKQVFKLGYKDSGMMGSETSQDPACQWATWQRDPESITRRVVEILREVRPQVVITFNKYGGYGHPDHIAIQGATTEAFKYVNDPKYVTGQPPYQPQKLYYSNIAKRVIQFGIALMRLRGVDPRKVGRNKDIDVMAILEHIEPNHTRVDIRDFYPQWDAASACHLSQGGGGGFRFLPKWTRKYLSPYQTFTRIYPKPSHDKIDEDDMFVNVTVDEPAVEPV